MKHIFTPLLFVFIFVFSSAGSGQLTIGGVVYNVDTLAQAKVGPGTYYTALKYSTSTKQLHTYFLAIDASNPYINFESVLAKDSLVGTERVSAMAVRKSTSGNNYFAGVNADFFATTGGVGTPVHGCMVAGQIGKTPANTPVVTFSDNTPILSEMTFDGTCTIGTQSLTIDNVNTTRGSNQLILYNNLVGNYTHTNAYGTEALIQLLDNETWGVNKTIKAKVVSIESNKGNTKILPGHAVLSGHGTAATFLSQLEAGEEVQLDLKINIAGIASPPDIRTMVGGDRFILRNGEVTDNDWADLHPRTCAGNSQDKKTVYFCVVDGRGISAGVSTKQLADIIKSAGAYDAINLDGGGSSALYTQALGVMNTPSDGNERAVGNAVYAINKAPDDNVIAEIRSSEKSKALPQYGMFTPLFYGYNQYGTLIDTDAKGVRLSCDPSMGEISADGTTFIAYGTQGGLLNADYNGVTTDIRIFIDNNVVPTLRLDSVLVDKAHPYSIEVQTMVGNKPMPLLPQALTWTIDNPSVCSIEDGILTGIANGSTEIHGELSGARVSQKVKVEIPATPVIPVDQLYDFSTWTIKSTSNIQNPVLTSTTLPTSIRYTYTSGRSPFVQLYRIFPLYSIPDSVKIVLNTQQTGVLSASVTVKANYAINYTPLQFTGIVKGEDYTLKLPMSMLLDDVNNRAAYPVYFEGLKLMLDASAQTVNQEYEILVKEFVLVYGNMSVGIDDPQILSRLKVYPNPVVNGEVRVALQTSDSSVHMELLTISGQKIYMETKRIDSNGEVSFSLRGIPSGIYLMKLYHGGKVDTVKLMIK